VQVGEKEGQLLVVADESRAKRIVIVQERVAANLVIEIPLVYVERELLLGRKRVAVIRSEKFQYGRFKLLGLAEVSIGEVIQAVIPHPESRSETQFGNPLWAAQEQLAIRGVEKSAEIKTPQVVRDACHKD
jgi:hypothetical protein